MPTNDYESAIARAQQALVDELMKGHDAIQDERDDLLKQVADLDGVIKEIDMRLQAITGTKKRTRVVGRGDQILSVLSAHGDPLTGDELLSALTADPAERARYGFALKKLQALGQIALDSGRYTIVPEPE